MNIPNILTVSRFFLTVVFASFAQGSGTGAAVLAVLVFTCAALTDWADGYLARKYDISTAFGKLMDPIADKALVLSAFFIFAYAGLWSLWLVYMIAAREILVTASRIQAMTRGQVIPAEKAGKIKTIFQMGTISAALVCRVLVIWSATAGFMKNYEILWRAGLDLLMIIATILTIWSGAVYWRNLDKPDHQ
ncbi:MAG: CDP-diacylglycerol--glycerol-3-phosphate 3-phosphatidyltransferase [Candidatus Omnitrophica bacterium]|nr:CDP-diacylglycerol--glycerol-3-phosphate 3-phosphatidyltransferase [Candidatus Omnitrophota bacterium]